MPRKKKTDELDLEASFFGDDDLDWLADEEEEAAPAQEVLPVAPPPPPPYVPPPGAVPSSGPPPAGPTMLPPEEMQSEIEELSQEAPTESVPKAPESFEIISDGDPPTLEVDPTSEEVPAHLRDQGEAEAEAPAAEPEPEASEPEPEVSEPEVPEPPAEEAVAEAPEEPEAAEAEPEEPVEEPLAAEAPSEAQVEWEEEEEPVVFTGDSLDAQETVPLVHTPPPPEPRLEADEAPVDLGFTPPAEPSAHTPLLRYEPVGDQEAWQAAADLLLAESRSQEGQQAALLLEAGLVQRLRLGRHDKAARLLQDAWNAGSIDPLVYEHLAEIATTRSDWRTALEARIQLAAVREGRGAQEAMNDAAHLAYARLGDAVESARFLEEALQHQPGDFSVLSELSERYAELDRGEDRARVLSLLAEQVSGRAAADFLWERGRLLQALSRHREAQEAFERARVAYPAHEPSFLALEEVFLNAHDQVGLATLYESEARREGQTDAGWWFLKAARLYRDAEQQGRADASFKAAVELGDPQALREQQAWLLRLERYDDLARSMAQEAEAEQDALARAFALYRLARVRERHLADLEGALEAYRAALEADPQALPAAEAVQRLLGRTGRHQELFTSLEGRLQHVADPNMKVSLLLRMGELAEGELGDLERARAAYQRILGEVSPGYLPAVLGMERVLTRLGDHQALSALIEERAALTDDPPYRAELLFRALGASIQADERAMELCRRALDAVPDHEPSLHLYCMGLEAQQRWSDLAAALEAAAERPGEDAWRASLYYRAARVLVDHDGDLDEASACLDRALEISPQFLPAVGLHRDLAQQRPGEALLEQLKRDAAQAEEGCADWLLVAAADLASELDSANPKEDLEGILARNPAHPGARAAHELHCLRHGDASGLVQLYQWALDGASTDAERARYGSLLADYLRNRWDAVGTGEALDQVIHAQGSPRPARALARTAGALALWSEADKLLAGLDTDEDRFHRARLLLTRLERLDEASEVLAGLTSSESLGLAASLLAARVALVRGDNDTAASLWAGVARGEGAITMRRTHALWAASLYQTAGHDQEALSLYRLAIELQPDSPQAFTAYCATLASQGETQGLAEAWDTFRPDDLRGKALAFDLSVHPEEARDGWAALAEASEHPLAALLHQEQILAGQEDWMGVYDVVSAQLQHLTVPEAREVLEAKRRWLLAEKLADTDEAWELYRGLHEESPEDREVTEALARIAGARGETEVAIQYLKELADHTDDKAEAARYQRRIGEAYEAVQRAEDARQAYLDALDHVPDDAEALAGLRRLAEAAEDWAGLVQVLRREAGLVDDSRKVQILVEISTLVQERLDEPAQAVDAWREVLEASPAHPEALTRLLGLAEQLGEWELFAEVGNALVPAAQEAERVVLLRRVGVACLDELGREDAVRYLEQAVSGSVVDGIAAKRLEAIYRERRDWPGAVRALVLQAQVAEAPAKVGLLAQAAQIELDLRHDRDEASRIYAELLEHDPDHEVALRFQSNYLYDSGRLEAALPLFERLEPHMDDNQDLDDFDVRLELSSFYYQFGEMLSLTERTDDAILRYERALELNPAHLPSLRSVGPLYTTTQAWKKAERVYRQLLQLTGGQGEPLQVATTYTQLGLVERALGNHDKAFKRFSKALEIHPNHLEALKGMALVLEDREDWSNLLAIYNNIIYHATVPADVVSAYMVKGRILDEEMGRPDKAAQHYERSLAFDANQPVALLRLAEIALRRQDWHEAGGLAQRGIKLTSAPESIRADLHAVLAAARKATGDVDGAADALDRARAASEALAPTLGDEVLDDIEALGKVIRGRLPQ